MRTGEVGRFFWLVMILSLPFYVLARAGHALPFAPALPLSALMAMVPMIAALVLVMRGGGTSAAVGLFKGAFDMRRIPNPGWVVAALTVMPVAFALTAGVLWLSGTALPALHLLPVGKVIPAFALFFPGAVAEEIGRQGYGYPRLNTRYSALRAAIIVGVVWALWHVIPFAQMGRSAAWIFWQGAGMVCIRIIIVWLVVNAGRSIAVAVLFHMMSNSVWGMFPDFGPWYDPQVMCLVLLAPVTVVVALCGPATLGSGRRG